MTQPPGQIRRRGAIAVLARERRLLVIRRSELVVAPGAYCFPGGGIEPGESEADALIRELDEELGVKVTPHRRLWESVTAWQVELAWWLASLPSAAEFSPNAAEVAETHWLTTAQIRQLSGLLSSNHEFLDALEAGVFQIDGLSH